MNKINFIFKFLSQLLYTIVISNSSVIAAILRQKYYNTKCFIDTQVYIRNSKNFKVGNKSALYHGTYILNAEGNFSIGNNSHLGAYCYVNVAKGNVSIGDDVSIGPSTKIIVYSNHFESGKKNSELRITKDIVIGNNVFIGTNCSILPGTTIGDNVVIGAGSVVKGDFPANAVYGGVPARKIKDIT